MRPWGPTQMLDVHLPGKLGERPRDDRQTFKKNVSKIKHHHVSFLRHGPWKHFAYNDQTLTILGDAALRPTVVTYAFI